MNGIFGDPDENRTRVTAVKGRCLNRLTTGPNKIYMKETEWAALLYRPPELFIFKMVAAVGFEPTTLRV